MGEEQEIPKRGLRKRQAMHDLMPQGFQLVISQGQASREQQKILQDREYTLTQAYGRALRLDPKTKDEWLKMTKTGMELLAHSTAIINPHDLDALEGFRQQSGLTEKREQLMNRLFAAMSFEKGLENLNALAPDGKEYKTMAELNQDYPNITKAEIILFSLLTTAPATFLAYGTREVPPPTTTTNREKGFVPVVTGLNPDGNMCFSAENINPNVTSAYEGYAQLGMTGTGENTELVPMKKELREVVQELIALSMTNYRLHERVWNRFDVSLSDGLSDIDRAALRKLFPDKFHSDPSLSTVKGSLAPAEREQFNKEKEHLDDRFGKNVLINVQKNSVSTPSDLVRLVGLLEGFPRGLLEGDDPYEGYFTPYGPGVLFVSRRGQREYFPYKAFYLRDALHGLYYESVENALDNRTAAFLFNELTAQAEAQAFQGFEATGENPSILEGIKADMKFELGIDLEVNPRIAVVATNFPTDAGQELTRELKKTITMKFSADEALHAFQTLKLLPKELLEGVDTLRKEITNDINIQTLMTGHTMLGEFRSGVVVVYQNPEIPYVHLTPEMKAVRAFTIIHEVMHSFWDNLSKQERGQWKSISWDEHGRRVDDTEDFLTMYSHIANESEDFCDHGASFVLHAQEFRSRAAQNESLQRKYDFIRGAIARRLGYEVAFPQMIPWTIEEIHGRVNEQVNKMTLVEAMQFMEEKETHEEIAARTTRAAVEQRLDEGKADDALEEGEREDAIPLLDDEGKEVDVLNREKEIGFKRSSIMDIIDYVGEYLTEEEARRTARSIFKLIEEDEMEKSLRRAKRHVDTDMWDEFVKHMEEIKLRLDAGTYT